MLSEAKTKMIFTNSDLAGGCLSSTSDASTPCDVDMMTIGSLEAAGGVPEVGAMEEAPVTTLTDVLDVPSDSPLLQNGLAVPLAVAGVETADDLVVIDLVTVGAVTTTADLLTPTTEAALLSSTAPMATPTSIAGMPIELNTPTRESLCLAIEELATTGASTPGSSSVGTVSPELATAALKAMTEGVMTPIIKEELRLTILRDRPDIDENTLSEEFKQPRPNTVRSILFYKPIFPHYKIYMALCFYTSICM